MAIRQARLEPLALSVSGRESFQRLGGSEWEETN